jgi:hypothetical protein
MSNEMKVAVVTGILAFVGAITGNYVVAHLDEQKSDRQFRQQFRVHILDMRLGIFDKCSRARAQLTYVNGLQQDVNRMVEHINSDKAAKAAYEEKGPPQAIREMKKEANSIVSEYLGCLISSRSMFGPKTGDAAEALMRANDYNPDDDKQAPLFNTFFAAMVEEATYR